MMNTPVSNHDAQGPGLKAASRFWEPLRLWYNGILIAVPLAWVTFSWPHFRGAVGSIFLWLVVFLAIANFCYCAGYLADGVLRSMASDSMWRRLRQVVWVIGILFSLLVENYWIADEIYPYPNDGPKAADLLGGGLNSVSTAHFASNINFPAPLAVLGFLAAAGGLVLAIGSILILWFARKPKIARWVAIGVGGCALVYFALLVGFSAASQSRMLAIGQEKYFCEIDCHLAYSVVDVKTQAEGTAANYIVTLRTRFDETTTSPSRPKDAPLTPSPREVRLIDSAGREYAPVSSDGTSLMTPLKPAESYTTRLDFRIPKDATGLRLLVNTLPAWPDRVAIGDENSWLHQKTYFAL